MMADFYRLLVLAFHKLKYSSNPMLRAYWLATRRRSQVDSSALKCCEDGEVTEQISRRC